MDRLSTSVYAIALIIVASLLKRDCNAEYAIPVLGLVTHNSVQIGVVSESGIKFHVRGSATLNPNGGGVDGTNQLPIAQTQHVFTGNSLNPLTYYVLTIDGLKEDAAGFPGIDFDPPSVQLPFCTKPEPPSDFKVDDTVNPSSNQIALQWTQPATTPDTYLVYLDGVLIKRLASPATNFIIASTDDADAESPTPLEPGTTYTCKLVARTAIPSGSKCADIDTEPQIVGCSTASTANSTSAAKDTKNSTSSVLIPKITLLCILVLVFFTE